MTIIQGGAQLRGAQHDRGRDICTRETNGAGAVGRAKLESDVTEDKQTADSDAPPPPRATEGERLAPFAADQQPMGNQHKHQRGPLLSTSNDGRATDRNKRKPKRSEKQRTTTMCVCMSVNKGQAVGQQKAAGDTRRSDESWRKEKRVASSSRLTPDARGSASGVSKISTTTARPREVDQRWQRCRANRRRNNLGGEETGGAERAGQTRSGQHHT